ncbi:MAG: hypothetical protein K1X31_01445 [Gemmatimonadaceae bacterium]|nr:hypothetical protein [Gemmatimonadaceae bacterium]
MGGTVAVNVCGRAARTMRRVNGFGWRYFTAMSDAPSPSPPPLATARTGGAWLSARASLAARRSRRFMVRWSVVVGTLTTLATVSALVPRAADPGVRAALDTVMIDTLRSAQRVRAAENTLATAESLMVASRDAALRPIAAPLPRPASPSAGATPDLADLAQRILSARAARSAEGYRHVAAHPLVEAGPRMRALADSLRRLEDARRMAGAAEPFTEAIGRVGRTIVAIADYRRAELEAQSGPAGGASAPPAPPAPAAPVRAVPVSVDTIAPAGALAAARDTVARLRRLHDSLVAAARTVAAANAASATDRTARSELVDFLPALALAAVLLVGLAVGFGTALRSEWEAPTLAGVAEAERLTGLRVLSVVREVPIDGPARFKPTGVDPFRMLYLGLTATGTRTRSAIVSGGDAEVVATVGARLAIAAAADHRSTLIADLDSGEASLSRTFRERIEPGVHEVLGRTFSWREVARPVGSSDGLPITMLPPGGDRVADAAIDAVTTEEFARFASSFELTLVLSPLEQIGAASSLAGPGPAVLTAVVGERSIDALLADVTRLQGTGRRIQGLILWDAPRPMLPTRAELVAELSKRKGRTPGGSFEAVQRAIRGSDTGNKRP